MGIEGYYLVANDFGLLNKINSLRRYWHLCRGHHSIPKTVEYSRFCGLFAKLYHKVCKNCTYFVHFRNLADALVAITALLAFDV